jgi:hypothetical protein
LPNPLPLTIHPPTEAESKIYSPPNIPDRLSQISEEGLVNPANIQALSPYTDLSSIGNQQDQIELQSPRSSAEKSNVVRQPLISKAISQLPIANPAYLDLSSIGDQQNQIELQSPRSSAEKSNVVSQPLISKAISQPPIANPANTEGLTKPLGTNDRTLGTTVQSLVPVAVRQIDQIVDAQSRGLQHRQDLAPSSPAPPTIQVKIGRIEIRAVTNPPPPQRSRPTASLPKLSLEDYLKSRGGG